MRGKTAFTIAVTASEDPPMDPTTTSDDTVSPGPLPVANNQKSLQPSRSYWSFKPEAVKQEEKKNRLEAGKERKWFRERFDPNPYRDLAEKALAEL